LNEITNKQISTYLQYNYGFEYELAELSTKIMSQYEYLPDTQFLVEQLSKQEIAAWSAISLCMPLNESEDNTSAFLPYSKANDPGYFRQVEFIIEQDRLDGKIGEPMYCELLSCLNFVREETIEFYGPKLSLVEPALLSKPENAEKILCEDYGLDKSLTRQHIELAMKEEIHGKMTASELAAFSMLLSAQEGRLTRPEIMVLMKTLGRRIENLSPWFQELVDLMAQVIRLQEKVEFGTETVG